MIFTKKNKFKPLYKKFLSLRENIQNRHKILKFKKQKWTKFIGSYKRKLKWYNKFCPQNQNQYIVSKFPNRYTSYQKKFKNTLQAVKTFRLFYGGLIKSLLKRIIKTIENRKTYNNSIFEIFEKRLDVVLYRAKFYTSLRSAQQNIAHGRVLVNNKIVKGKNLFLNTGDIISLTSKQNINIRKSEIWPLPPKHLIINYKTLQIIFGHIKNINIATLFPFYLNIEKILINYRKQ